MVTTRSKTGVLTIPKYDALSLRLNEITLSPTSPLLQPNSPSKIRKTRRRSSICRRRIEGLAPRPNPPSLTSEQQAEQRAFISQALKDFAPTPLSELRSKEDLFDGHYGPFPARSWGEKELVGLSKIGRAEKDVEIWEAVVEAHKLDAVPDLVPVCEAKLREAREARAKLEDTEENHRVGIPQAFPGEVAIKDRIESLEWGLGTSKFAPEGENIRAAIQGYKSGAIGFNKHYTLIYAGKIVDTAKTYSDFVKDRNKRLDRYGEAHGHHWLWYEQPLNVHPETIPTAMASCGLPREDSWSNLGAWHINQGFWKREGWVARMPTLRYAVPAPINFAVNHEGKVDVNSAGPKLCFRTLLDSGATFPSLHTEDLLSLGIDRNYYAAQNIQSLSTANGVVNSRIYEMAVCVLDEAGRHLVDPNNAMWPDFQNYLGGLCPVQECTNPLRYDVNGMEIDTRLSGLMPFLACYLSSTPTRNMLYLGEDRNDVLGGHRMPGQRKWDIAMPNGPPVSSLQWDRYDNPKITFNHRQGLIMDEDDPNAQFRSIITVMRGTDQERTEIVDPRRDTETLREAFVARHDDWAHLRRPGAVWEREDFLRLLDHAQRDPNWRPLLPGSNPFDAAPDNRPH